MEPQAISHVILERLHTHICQIQILIGFSNYRKITRENLSHYIDIELRLILESM